MGKIQYNQAFKGFRANSSGVIHFRKYVKHYSVVFQLSLELVRDSPSAGVIDLNVLVCRSNLLSRSLS